MAVTIADVKVLYSSSGLSDTAITEALDTASLIVDEQLRPNCVMSEDRYDKITKYLACHIMSISASAEGGSPSGGALRRDKLGDADQSYAVPDGADFGYQSTRWGQMALALDTCGILANASTNKSVKAQFRVVGTPS